MGDVIRLPDQVLPSRLISKLVEAGYLRSARRDNPDAVRKAIEESRSRPTDIFGRPEEDNDPPAVA
jgi:hypothetical protein